MPDNQNPYMDPSMNPGGYVPNMPGYGQQGYVDPSSPYAQQGVQPDMSGQWGQGYGMGQQGYGQDMYGVPMDGYGMGNMDSPQDIYEAQAQGGMGAQQYGGYPDPNALYGAQPYQQGGQPYQYSPYYEQAPQGVQPGGYDPSMQTAQYDISEPYAPQPDPMQAAPAMPQQQDYQAWQQQNAPAPQQPSGVDAQMPQAPSPYDYGYGYVGGEPIDPSLATSSQATKCLVFGLLSIIFGLLPPIGILFGVLTIRMARRYHANGGDENKGEAGRVFGIVGFIFSTLMLLFVVGFIFFMVGALSGTQAATDLITYFNYSPLGSLVQIPLP